MRRVVGVETGRAGASGEDKAGAATDGLCTHPSLVTRRKPGGERNTKVKP